MNIPFPLKFLESCLIDHSTLKPLGRALNLDWKIFSRGYIYLIEQARRPYWENIGPRSG